MASARRRAATAGVASTAIDVTRSIEVAAARFLLDEKFRQRRTEHGAQLAVQPVQRGRGRQLGGTSRGVSERIAPAPNEKKAHRGRERAGKGSTPCERGRQVALRLEARDITTS